MNALWHAIAMNNEGANLLDSGDTVNAIRAFRNAMIALTDAPDDKGRCMSMTKATSAEQDCRPFDAPCEGMLVMYSRPLVFPTNISASKPEMSQLRDTLSSYAVFNYALACHLHGLSTGKDAALKRACHLYHVIIGTKSAPSTGMPCNVMPCDLLQSLAFNNLALLNYSWCDYRESFRCMLECVERIECSTSMLQCLSRREAQDIHLNGIFMDVPFTAQAA